MIARLLSCGSLVAMMLVGHVASPAAAQTAVQARTAQSAVNEQGQRLRALFAASDETSLKRNPLNALFRGDLRYAGQFGDYITDAYIAAERQAAEADLAALARIDRAALSSDDLVSYDVFKWQRTLDLRGFQPDLVAPTIVRPIDHFTGLQASFPDISTGESVAQFKTLDDYENGLKRLDGYATYFDRSIGRFREGMKAGVTHPKLLTERLIGQLDTYIAQGIDNSPFYKPVLKFPATIPAAEQARLRAAYRDKLAKAVIPAYTRMRDFLRTQYLPVSRAQVGLYAMPGGEKVYAYAIEQLTTTRMRPEEIHQLGLGDVARILGEMEKVKNDVGFTGTLPQFFEHIRTDPKFKPKSKDELRDMYREVEARLAPELPKLFSVAPKAPLEIRAIPDYLEKTAAGGSYREGTPDGSRPGVFFYNAYDLPSRTIEGVETLYLHEGAPGHHFQISLAQENTNLPAFQRFGGPTAFAEGWALYAETLGHELGMFKDPYQYFGHLKDQMLRAMRLVVDTGIHAKGWTREQAIQYMLDNSPMGKTDATIEVDRYIAWPAQALAYKIGQLKFRELRTKAERELGSQFDIREFHAQVLMSGAIPLSVLEAKIDRWIAGKKRG